jgi:LuxR family maltose regulon positive regulatory protein
VNLDAIGAVCHLLLGNLDEALQLVEEEVDAVAARWPAAEVTCFSARSHVAFARGTLSEADGWASRALEAAERAGFDRHPSAFFALRTKALLALERREFGSAAELTERRQDFGWPYLNFLAQLDRARIWGAEGSLDEALASLPAVRRALLSDHSILLAEADELEARTRLALGDVSGTMTIANRLPDRRSGVISAMVYLQTGQPQQALAALDALPAQQPTVRSDLELQLLRAEAGLRQQLDEAPRLVREVLDVAARHGFVQTILDTVPQLLQHVISDSDLYPRSEHLAALVAAGVDARQRTPREPQEGPLVDPLTEAEIRVLRRIAERVTYGDVAIDLQVSLNTVKTHLRHSYTKLGVTSRSAAIKRAVSLGLL